MTACAQSDVPEVVQQAFKAKYGSLGNVEWNVDAHGYFEAQFKDKGEKYRADFTKDGQWVETENDIKYKELPKAIRKVIESKYSDRKVTEVEHVTHHSKGEFFDVEFKQKGKNMDVEFRADGTIIN